MTDDNQLTRRQFLTQSAAGAAAVGLGLYATAPSSARGANERINLGVIGCGGQGTWHLSQLVEMSQNPEAGLAVTAVCDIYEPRKQRAKEISGGQLFHDYRKMLEMKDLDAVVIATPDHWHARMSIDAMEAGKDVYCEKPMTRYWAEAKGVARAAARTGRVYQCGAQTASEDRWWRANGLIQEGAIGKVLWSQSSMCRNSRKGEWNWRMDPQAGPDNLDWPAFLGPAPKRPFDPERFFRFRKYWDYSGGIASDLFYHQLAHLAIALGPEFPVRVSAAGGIYAFPDREVPDTYHTLIDYPSDHSVALVSSMANQQGIPDIIYGHEATMYFEGPGVVIRPEPDFAAERPAMEVAARPRADHMHNFLDCVRTREKPHLNADAAYRVMVAIALGVTAYRGQRTVHFDPEKEEVV
jgi:predicted dehydrogenase